MSTLTAHANPRLLTARVRELVDGGRVRAARPLLAALRKAAPALPDLDELEARLLLHEGRTPEALATLDHAIAEAPGSMALRICRAEARARIDDLHGAVADAADAVMLAPRNAQAKAMLGVLLIELNRMPDAVTCLAEAARQEPLRASYRLGLAEAQERGGDPTAAEATLADGIARAPGDVRLRVAAIMLAMRRRDFTRAAALAEAARQAGATDARVFGLLGHALSKLGRHDPSATAYAEALKLAPEDPYVRHLVQAAGLLPAAPRAPVEYLQTVFDGYAERFDTHLIGLGYRTPGLMREILAARPPPDGPVLDLGCGTGLVGLAVSDLGLGRLVGVDLSRRMLDEAAAKGLYGELIHTDVETILADEDRDWAAILAADVFCYFGVLDRVLALAQARLRPGGVFIFSVEVLDGAAPPEGWRLGRLGRYAHHPDYVAAAIARSGLRLHALRRETLRDEADAPVAGLLAVLERG